MVFSTTATYCLVDGKREIYEAYETRDKPGIIEYLTSDDRTLEEMETDISQ